MFDPIRTAQHYQGMIDVMYVIERLHQFVKTHRGLDIQALCTRLATVIDTQEQLIIELSKEVTKL